MRRRDENVKNKLLTSPSAPFTTCHMFSYAGPRRRRRRVGTLSHLSREAASGSAQGPSPHVPRGEGKNSVPLRKVRRTLPPPCAVRSSSKRRRPCPSSSLPWVFRGWWALRARKGDGRRGVISAERKAAARVRSRGGSVVRPLRFSPASQPLDHALHQCGQVRLRAAGGSGRCARHWQAAAPQEGTTRFARGLECAVAARSPLITDRPIHIISESDADRLALLQRVARPVGGRIGAGHPRR